MKPRVRGLTRGYMPSPASRVTCRAWDLHSPLSECDAACYSDLRVSGRIQSAERAEPT